MKRLPSFLALALIASLAAAPSVFAQGKAGAPTPPTAPSQPTTQPPKATPPKTDAPKTTDRPKTEAPKSDDKMKAYEDANKPGPNHKMLEQFEGEWAAEAKDLTPGEETTDKGTMSCEMRYGKRFLSMDYDGRNHGKFFKGGGMMGYNNAEKRFEATWADSMTTGIMFMTGSASGDGKTFTLTGDAIDPTTGKKATWKEVISITAKDAWHDEFFMVAGGKEMKIMEINYTRASKTAPKGDTPKTDAPKTDDKPKK